MSKGLNYETFICSGALMLVADELSAPERQDGLDALLYAQTVASHQFPNADEHDSWVHANKMAMRTLGGMLFSDPYVSLPVPLPGSFDLSELAQQVLRQWLPAAGVKFLNTCLQRLSSPAKDVLRKHALQQDRQVRFQFGVMSAGTTLTVATIAFAYDEAIVGDLSAYRFLPEKVLANVSVSGYRVNLEPEDYDLSRATVISLLGNRRQERIIQLNG
ncbi:hypothetical protein [Pseudomonas sp. PD9R]|uniref:hypothetical protein n=1 Tax=Pseudomonas sp. PD9R TaxID=2853534 RepID=UPI001C45C830|nr:hypothetical protein [Pseudomonas sp. PD9R]MBV6826158.1 hypothetical protein [Pseudomonas sp. PD9R]